VGSFISSTAHRRGDKEATAISLPYRTATGNKLHLEIQPITKGSGSVRFDSVTDASICILQINYGIPVTDAFNNSTN